MQQRFFSKSQAAFLMSCEKFFETWPKAYFWTFTFVKKAMGRERGEAAPRP